MGTWTVAIPCTFTCRRWLFAVETAYTTSIDHDDYETAESRAIAELAGKVAAVVPQPLRVLGAHVVVEADEPIDALVPFSLLSGLKVMTIIASQPAVELLLDPTPPASLMWSELCAQTKRTLVPPDGPGMFRVGSNYERALPADAEAMPEGPGVWLWIRGTERDRVLWIERTTTFGRGHATVPVDVAIEDRLISRRQCRIIAERGWWIEDAGSTSGTYFWRSQIRARVALVPGMDIAVGGSNLVVLAVR